MAILLTMVTGVEEIKNEAPVAHLPEHLLVVLRTTGGTDFIEITPAAARELAERLLEHLRSP